MNFSIKLPLLIISLIQIISSVISNSIFKDSVHSIFLSHLYGANFMQNVPAGKAKYLKGHGDIETVPYIVQLENKKSRHFCGGSIIRDDVIITAGHCLRAETPKSFQIRAGSIIRGKFMNVTQLVEVLTYEIHPQFYSNTQMGTVLNDIGLVRLKNKLKLSDYVNIVRLAKDDMADKLYGEKVVTYGWGLTETTYPADVLKFTELIIIQKQLCKFLYDNKLHLSKSNLCALDKRREMGSLCSGDSGGPLILRSSKQYSPNGDYLVGISSFVNRPGYMCKPNYPSVFTDVAKIKPWIKDILRKWN